MISDRHKILIYFSVVFIVSFVCRYNVLNNFFVLDDFVLIINNVFIHNFNNLTEILNPKNIFYVLPVKCGARPLAVTSLIVDYSLYGSSPFGYHLFNLLLHCANSLLLFLFVFFFNNKKSLFCALVASLFFSLHPIQSEVVSVISFRADLLLVFFYLITLNLIILTQKYDKYNKSSYLLVFFMICCAFFTKENAISIPFILLTFSFFVSKNIKLVKFSLASLIIIIFLFFFFWVERFPVPLYFTIYTNLYENIVPLFNIWTYFNTIITSLFYNVLHIIYPINLSVDYTVAFSVYKTVVTVFFAFLAIFLFIKKVDDKYIKFSIVSAVITYLPVSNIIPLVNTVADRYMYMPMVAISVFFALSVNKVSQYVNKKLIYFFVVCLLLFNVIISYQRGETYNNQYTLYSDAILKNPENIRVLYNMGVSYFANKEYEKAVSSFNKVSRINPVYMRDKVWLLTAMAYDGLQKKELARQYYYKSFLLNPLDSDICSSFISSFLSFEEAKKYILSRTVRLNDNIYFALEKCQKIQTLPPKN